MTRFPIRPRAPRDREPSRPAAAAPVSNLEQLRAHCRDRAGKALARGLAQLRAGPAVPADPERTWRRVAPLLTARQARVRPHARRWQLAAALLPVLAVAVVGIAYLARDRSELVPAADYGWVAEPPRREPWVDDPAGESTDRLFSALDLDSKPKHP